LISFFDTFKTDSIYGVSTTIRLNAYKYYFGLIKNSPILGIGAVVGGNTIGNKILHGPYGLFFLDDVGLLAGVVRYGLLGIINYVLIFKNLCPFSTVYREEKSDYHTLLIGIYISMLIWGLNMDCYMLTNVIAMPIMFAIFTAYPECD
jgi:hypothetical protein